MLPATKSVPKELLPIVERPALQYVLDELYGAGVDHVVVISAPDKTAITEYLAPSPEVEAVLDRLGRADLSAQQHRIGREMRISVTMQHEARGLGHAVAQARAAVGDEPFFVVLPDELMGSSQLLEEMNQVHQRTESSVIAVKKMPIEEISRYGVVSPIGANRGSSGLLDEIPSELKGRVALFDDVVEKPRPEQAPSDLAIIGRYLLTPDIFDDLDRIEPGASGELQLTDALALQTRRRPSCALTSEVHRRDIGHPIGWVKAVIERALDHPDTGFEIEAWLQEVLTERRHSS